MRPLLQGCTGVAIFAALLGLTGAATVAPAYADDAATARPLSTFPRETIIIETRAARRHTFEAWRADDAETRAQGLMFVPKLDPARAMIFVYEPPQFVGMWMKNTLIPLDMLFVDERGCVAMLHEEAQPGALDVIAADDPIALVVELAGGTARRLGLRQGDRVVRPAAGWPGPAETPCSSKP